MRRSKSDPAKYARNYRKISQRRMTQYDGLDEEKEMKRLRSILRQSEKHLEQVPDEEPPADTKTKRKRHTQKAQEPSTDADMSIFSKEFLKEQGHGEFGDDDNPLYVQRKKKKNKKPRVQLTPEEIKEAKALQKKTVRKLQQLEARATQKKKRAQLYKKLQEDQKSQAGLQPLLLASGKLSRKNTDTKKQAVKKIFNKEQAGLELTAEEQDILCPERTIVDEMPSSSHSNNANLFLKPQDSSSKEANKKGDKAENTKSKEGKPTDDKAKESNEKKSDISKPKQSNPAMDFAAQMMASLTTLKKTTEEKAAEAPKPDKDVVT